MKDFLGLFLGSFIMILIVIFFFGGYLFTNIWAAIILVSFILATIAKTFINQDSRIIELEKKLEQLLNKDDKSEY